MIESIAKCPRCGRWVTVRNRRNIPEHWYVVCEDWPKCRYGHDIKKSDAWELLDALTRDGQHLLDMIRDRQFLDGSWDYLALIQDVADEIQESINTATGFARRSVTYHYPRNGKYVQR